LIIPPPRTKHAELKNPPKNLAQIKADKLGAAPDARFVNRNRTFVIFVIRRLPYNSDNGAQSNGPAAYPVTKINSKKAATVSDVLPKDARTDFNAGANITPERGLKLELLTVWDTIRWLLMSE